MSILDNQIVILESLEELHKKVDRLLAVGFARQMEKHIVWHGGSSGHIPKTEKKELCECGHSVLVHDPVSCRYCDCLIYKTASGGDHIHKWVYKNGRDRCNCGADKPTTEKLPLEATTNFALPMTGKYQWYRLIDQDGKVRKCENEGCDLFLLWNKDKKKYEHWKYDVNTGKAGFVSDSCEGFYNG